MNLLNVANLNDQRHIKQFNCVDFSEYHKCSILIKKISDILNLTNVAKIIRGYKLYIFLSHHGLNLLNVANLGTYKKYV